MRAEHLGALLLFLLPAPAHAGTVTMVNSLERGHEVTWVAAGGETNDLRVSRDERGLVVQDAGAPVTAGLGCEPVSPHVARCPVALHEPLRVAASCGDGDDVALATDVRVTIDGGPGSDRLTGGGAGGFGYEATLIGGPGDDRLTGDESNDSLSGGTGVDVLTGGDGGDHFFGEHEHGDVSSDVVDGGPGTDLVLYQTRTAPLVVDTVAQRSGQAGEDDRLTSVEGAIGGSGDDRFVGNGEWNTFFGGAGDDVITGEGGRDSLAGDAGSDTIDGGRGGDQLYGGPGADRLVAGPGGDLVFGDGHRDEAGEAGDRIDAGSGNDFVRSNASVVCGSGRDGLVGRSPRRRFPHDCEAADGGPVSILLRPVRLTSRTIVFRVGVGFDGARVGGATLRAGRTVLARSAVRRLDGGQRVLWTLRLTRAGRRAFRDGAAEATLRVGGRDRVRAVFSRR